ncbi:MAG: DUF47 domain-containing protein [Bacteroidales bacterium]
MALLFKTAKEVIVNIDEFYDNVEQGLLIFKEGVENYLYERHDQFRKNIETLHEMEAAADDRQIEIENEFYLHSLLPQYASDVMNLLEQSDELIDVPKHNLDRFDVEQPYIPKKLADSFIKITDTSIKAGEYAIPAARTLFRDINSVREKLTKVFFYERETDNLALQLKRDVFKMDDLELSQKMHLRYFILHIETISDKAKQVADLLSLMAIKIKF